MKESELYHKLKYWLPGETQRVETGTGGGFPDIVGTWQGITYFVEAKVGQACFNKWQYAWMQRHKLPKINARFFILLTNKRGEDIRIWTGNNLPLMRVLESGRIKLAGPPFVHFKEPVSSVVIEHKIQQMLLNYDYL